MSDEEELYNDDSEELEESSDDSQDISNDVDTTSDSTDDFGPSEEAPHGIGGLPGNIKWTTLKNVVTSSKFAPILVVGGLFVLILMVVVLGFAGISDEYVYIAPRCSSMRVSFGDEGSTTVPLEQYIISHIYSATKDMNEIDSNLYRTLAIALNTEIQASGVCSKTFISDENDIYSFEILDTSSDIYTDIKNDIKEVKDLAMINKTTKGYYSVSLDGFCYNSQVEDEIPYYTIPQLEYHIPSEWVVENVNNWNFINCPCNDPDSALDSDACYEDENYVDGGTGLGISIYAAHYLTSVDNMSYESVLKLFYPNNDWELASNDKSYDNNRNNTNKCSGGNVPFESTPLSRREFISLVTEFLTSGSYADYAQLFIDHAGDIYDMGEEKGINPELIYIFARKETSFSSVSSDTNHYNYYGMGHCNTCANGTFYDSFMEGVEALFDYFVRKGSLDEVVKTYSYLGTYLYNYNPKLEQGAGGCYYLEIIYGDNYSRCDDSYYCSPDSTANCVYTTEEERNAYIEWQAEKYIEHRQAIFKLGKEVCYGTTIETEANLNVPSQQLKESLSSFLTSNASSVSELNATIRDNVVEAGVGSRGAVATAATTLINYMSQFGLRIPYTFGGGHASSVYDFRSSQNVNVNKSINSYYGVDPDWGTPIFDEKKYTHYGPDCSGFVNWAMKNGGMRNVSAITPDGTVYLYGFISQNHQYLDNVTVHQMNGSYIGQVGDVVFSRGHIRLIVGVNIQEMYYITAESQTDTEPYRPEFKGISYEQMNFSVSNYRIVDLTEFYDNPSNYLSESEYINAFNNNQLG